MRGRVLFVANVYGHLANFHIPYMRLLADHGYEVHAAASSTQGRRSEIEAVGVTCHDVPFVRAPYSPANLRAAAELRALLSQQHFCLIHAHTPIAAFLARYLAKAERQGPVLYTAHGFHFHAHAPRRDWLIYYNLERLAARWTDGIIVMNDEDYSSALRMGYRPGISLFRTHGVGVDIGRFSPASNRDGGIRREIGVGEDAVLAICVAELTPNKNLRFLLSAWRRISCDHADAHLLLVGDGSERIALEAIVRRSRIPRVHFLGFRRDVPRILAEADIVTLVSRREGLPRAIMEAMAMGKPVVATDVRGCRDLVDHGRTGLLVQTGNVRELVGALKRLIEDVDLRGRLGAAGLERIQAYSLGTTVKEMVAIYSRFIDIS